LIGACELFLEADHDYTGLKTALVEGVVWDINAEISTYWDELRSAVLLGGRNDSREYRKPFIKVFTTRKGDAERIDGKDLFERYKGHVFYNKAVHSLRSAMNPIQAATDFNLTPKANFGNPMINRDRSGLSLSPADSLSHSASIVHNPAFVHRNSFDYTMDVMHVAVPKMSPLKSVNNDVNEIMGKLNAVGNPLNLREAEIELGLKIANVAKQNMNVGEQYGKGGGLTQNVTQLYQEHLSRGGKLVKSLAVSVDKGKQYTKRKVPSSENWGKYQRMGGEPRMHKAFDLSSAPFEPATSKRWVGPEDPDYPDAGKNDDTVNSVVEEPDTSIKMVPQMTCEEMNMAIGLSEYEILHRDQKANDMISRMEAGVGFTEEDDYLFIPLIEAVDMNPFLLQDPNIQKRVEAVRGSVLQHKKVETLRAIGNSLLLPAAPPSSSNNSLYLGALGGVAPPAGMYSNSVSIMASTPGSGLPIQTPYKATMGQFAPFSPFINWSQMATTPTLGFYDNMTPSADSGMGMNIGGGRRSSLGQIARTHSRSDTQSNIGGGTSLRADSPAFRSTVTPSDSRNMFSTPVTGRGLQGQQHGGVQDRQYPAPGADWEYARSWQNQPQDVVQCRELLGPGADWEKAHGYHGEQRGGIQVQADSSWEAGRGYPGQGQGQGQQYGPALEVGRTGSRASGLHGQEQQCSRSARGRSIVSANPIDESADVDPLAAAAKKGFGWLN
jgi:hypothetical protein